MVGGAAVYFLAANMSIGVKITGLLFSILTELQTVALTLECVPLLCSVVLYLDSQLAINIYVSEASFTVKVKSHSDMSGNVKTNVLANNATSSSLFLLVRIWERFLVAERTAVSGNELEE
ncbi:hypothetical protein G9A89_003118 [Geosiphon pyriformis]|nr:hypothetical protein G9A89_003118 [Geosiphon pyriformis]